MDRETIFQIEIVNWEKYNKGAPKNAVWFRLNNDWWRDAKVASLCSSAKLTWIILVSEASKSGGKVDINLYQMRIITDQRGAKLVQIIQKLEQLQMIKILDRKVSLPTNKQTDKQTDKTALVQQEIALPTFDKFEEAWKQYPRRKGIKDAKRHYKKYITDQKTHDRLIKAINNYSAYTKVKKTDEEFIKLGSTFFNNNWQEWEEVEQQESELDFDALADKQAAERAAHEKYRREHGI